MSKNTYDCIIIGAGMSGLAAGIRLAMFDKKVCILESHSIAGGLNSYYQRKGFLLDVGLHALTNFAHPKEKKGPLGKLLKQLRIPYESLHLKEQIQSRIVFDQTSLTFTNDLSILMAEVERVFPQELDHFVELIQYIKNYDELSYNNKYLSAKDVVSTFIKSPLLLEMIFCPVLIYGSAWENDMDFSQFVIMFKSIFLEGFSRPAGGVRTIINLLIEKFESLGGEIKYRHPVERILTLNKTVTGIETKKGEVIHAKKVLSSAGLAETHLLLGKEKNDSLVGRMAFTETILLTDHLPKSFGVEDTIIFYNKGDYYQYRCPDKLYDPSSAVLCLTNNFKDDQEGHGIYRVTNMANYDFWKSLERNTYKEKKLEVLESSKELVKTLIPSWTGEILLTDVFTPTTIKKYTRHEKGCVYGSPEKKKDGRTDIKNLYLCGTDQGFLGVVGAMLSGISMANLHVLMD